MNSGGLLSPSLRPVSIVEGREGQPKSTMERRTVRTSLRGEEIFKDAERNGSPRPRRTNADDVASVFRNLPRTLEGTNVSRAFDGPVDTTIVGRESLYLRDEVGVGSEESVSSSELFGEVEFGLNDVDNDDSLQAEVDAGKEGSDSDGAETGDGEGRLLLRFEAAGGCEKGERKVK
jgi:hypothetical protein